MSEQSEQSEPVVFTPCVEKLPKTRVSSSRKKTSVSEIRPSAYSITRRSEIVLSHVTDYTVSELKHVLEILGAKKTGTKQVLLTRVIEWVDHHIRSTLIQRIYRGWRLRKVYNWFIKSELARDKCMNCTDFYNLDNLSDIPKYKFVAFSDISGVWYGFSVYSLYTLCKPHQPPTSSSSSSNARSSKMSLAINPYTRTPIPRDVVCNVLRLPEISYIRHQFSDVSESVTELNELTHETRYELRVVQLFQTINELGNYSNPVWFLELTNHKLLGLIAHLRDIWYYRAELGHVIRHNICPGGNPFAPSLHNTDTTMLLDLSLKHRVLDILTRFVTRGIDTDSKTLGATFVLCALTLVSESAATALPWLYASVHLGNAGV